VGSLLCYLSFSCATSTIAHATLNDFFNALTGWIVSSVNWLLSTVVAVLNATSDPATIVHAATHEFGVLEQFSPWLLLLGLLVATMQAIRHVDHYALWRLYLGVAPACVAGIVLAQPVALMTLQLCDEMSTGALSNSVIHLGDMGTALNHVGSLPSFGVFLLSSLVVVAAVLLWIELLLRTVVLTFLLVLVPLVAPLSVFPAMRRAGWRLAETFLAVAAAKVVVVIALALGLSEVTTANATSVLAGVVTVLLACATPFLLLRLVPLMEQSSLHAMDGLRHRAVRAAQASPDSPLGYAVSALLPARMPKPPHVPEDFGIPEWESEGDLPLPDVSEGRLPPPVGLPRVRHGHVVWQRDKWGPVMGWHWDD